MNYTEKIIAYEMGLSEELQKIINDNNLGLNDILIDNKERFGIYSDVKKFNTFNDSMKIINILTNEITKTIVFQITKIELNKETIEGNYSYKIYVEKS